MIHEIIDKHIDNGLNFLFVCNKYLAKYICMYMEDTYEVIDEYCGLKDEECEEFYVGIYFENEKMHFYCENARGMNGEFKLSDLDQCDYYVGLEDMNDELMYDKLLALKGDWIRLNNLDDDFDELIDAYVEMIIDARGCRRCIKGFLEDLVEEVLV